MRIMLSLLVKEGKMKRFSSREVPNMEEDIIRSFQIPLMGGGIAVVQIPVPMSEGNFAQIIETLHIWEIALVQPDERCTY